MSQIHFKTLVRNKRKKTLISSTKQFATYVAAMISIVIVWYFVGRYIDTWEIQKSIALDASICSYNPMGIIQSDCEALIDLYNSTSGDSWTNKTNRWSTWWAFWYGITTFWNRVSGINVNNNQLSWFMPTSIGNLTGLVGLYLNNNNISWPIPVEIGNLTELVSLDLNNNNISWPIPVEIGNLTELTYLDFSDNEFTWLITGNRSNLTWGISTLYLQWNGFSWALPSLLSPNMWVNDDIYFANPWLCGVFPIWLSGLIDDQASLNIDINNIVNWQLCSNGLYCNTNADCTSNNCTSNTCVWSLPSNSKFLDIIKTVSGWNEYISWSTVYYNLHWKNSTGINITSGTIKDTFWTWLTYSWSSIAPSSIVGNEITWTGLVFTWNNNWDITIWFVVTWSIWDIVSNIGYMWYVSWTDQFYTWDNNYWYENEDISITWNIIPGGSNKLLNIAKTVSGGVHDYVSWDAVYYYLSRSNSNIADITWWVIIDEFDTWLTFSGTDFLWVYIAWVNSITFSDITFTWNSTWQITVWFTATWDPWDTINNIWSIGIMSGWVFDTWYSQDRYDEEYINISSSCVVDSDCSDWYMCSINNICIPKPKTLNITKTVSGDYNYTSWEIVYYHLDRSNTGSTSYTGQIIDLFDTWLIYLTSSTIPTDINLPMRTITYSGIVFTWSSTGRITLEFEVYGDTWTVIYNTWEMYAFSWSDSYYTWYNQNWYSSKYINITWDIINPPTWWDDLLGIEKTLNGKIINWFLITWGAINSGDLIEYKLHWYKNTGATLPIMIKDYFSSGTMDFIYARLLYSNNTVPASRYRYPSNFTNTGELIFIFTWNNWQNLSGDILVRFKTKGNSGDLLTNSGSIWLSGTNDIVYDIVTGNNRSDTLHYIGPDRLDVDIYINKTSNKGTYVSWELVTWDINFGNTWDVVCNDMKIIDNYYYYATWWILYETNSWHFDLMPNGTIWWYSYAFSTWGGLVIDIWTLWIWQTGSITLTGIAHGYRVSNEVQMILSWDCRLNTNNNYNYNLNTYGYRTIDIFERSSYDLALVKQSSNIPPIQYWDMATYQIIIYNQWSEPASGINIIDYTPSNFVMQPWQSTIWWLSSWSNYIYNYTGTIAPRSNSVIYITYQINKTWSIDSYAEIYGTSNGVDIDSTPDAIWDNDGIVVDGDIYWNSFSWEDEDDHDIDTIYVYDQWAWSDLVDIAHRSVFVWEYPYSSWITTGTEYKFRLYFLNQWTRNISTISYQARVYDPTISNPLSNILAWYITWLYLSPWGQKYVDISIIFTWADSSYKSGVLYSEISNIVSYSWNNPLLNQISHTWDVDSIFYNLGIGDDFFNDPVIDDEVWLTPAQWDEDDHDIAYFWWATRLPTLSINKSVNTWVTASGTMVTYTISYSSNALCSWVTIQDILPPSSRFTFGWATHNGVSVWTVVNNIWRYDIGWLQANIIGNITITWVVYGNTNDIVTNTATISGNCVNNTYSSTTSVAIQNPINNTTTATADLSITKEILQSGNPTVYRIRYINNGPNTATWVVITEILPSNVFSSVLYSINPVNSQRSLWNLTSWTSGVIIVTWNISSSWNWPYTNTVTIASTTYDNNITNNNSSATASYNQNTSNTYVDLWVTKTISNWSIMKWSNFNWYITYTNYGNKTAYDVCITDTIPNWLTYVSNNLNINPQYLWANQLKFCISQVWSWQSNSFYITTRSDTPGTYVNRAYITWSENINGSNDNSSAIVTIYDSVVNSWTNTWTNITTIVSSGTSENSQIISYLQNQVNALQNQVNNTYSYLSSMLGINWQVNNASNIWIKVLPKTWADR